MTENNNRWNTKVDVGRMVLLCVLLAFCLSLPTAMAQNSTLTGRYTKERPVTIICDWDKPPYEFLNDRGMPAGSNIDIMRTIMQELNLPYRFVMKEWGNAIKTFERGDADLILANVRRYRKPPYAVTNNIVNYNRIKVATQVKDSVAYVSQKMLEEGHAVFKPSDYAAKFFIDQDSIRASKIEFQSPKVALTGVVAGDNKYFVWGEAALKWKIKELNLEGITLCDVDIPISEIHVIGRDKTLIEVIDDHYSRLKQSGEIERLRNPWFHPERVQNSTSSLTAYTAAVCLLLIMLFYLFYRLSRAQVRKDTRNAADLNNIIYKALQMSNFIVTEYDIRGDRMTNRYGQLLPDDGMTLEQFISHIHPTEQEGFRHKTERLTSGRERKSELDKHWQTDSGEWLKLHVHAMVEQDADGHPAYIIYAVNKEPHDVQEDKKYHDLILKYDSLFNMPLIAMTLYDKDGWPLVINDAMKKLCGFENSDNERYWNSLCIFDIPSLRNIYSPNDCHDLIICQHMEYPEMGINRYIEFHLHPIVNERGEVTNYLTSTLDITDERERVHQIYEQERRIRQANNQINMYEKRLRYLMANGKMYVWRSDQAAQKIEFTRNLRKQEYTETFDEFMARLDENQRQRTFEIWNAPNATGEMRSDILHFTRTPDGDYPKWCNSVGLPLYDNQGTITGYFGIIRDINDLVEAQQHLREETARAKDSGHQKTMFLASMTHEIRTPLNSIVGFSDLLSTIDTPEERREFIRIIRTNCEMLLRLINDILEVSSINDGPQSVSPTDIDFATAFDDICQTLQQRIQSPDVQFISENPYNSYPTRLDIGRIQQVVTNFVINAVKYTSQGHIRVGWKSTSDPSLLGMRTVTSSDEKASEKNIYFPPLQEGAGGGADGLLIYCEDTGTGIPKDKQASIFERFVKLNEFVQGTGLGLSICKSIAERCGGHIGVESEGEGYGSTFWIWIPCPHTSTPIEQHQKSDSHESAKL